MGWEIMLSGIATAGSVGVGCGTCCGSGISAFLSGYLMTHARSFRQSFAGFLTFYLGKIIAVVSICLASSFAGKHLLDKEGYMGQVPLIKVVDVCMMAMALWLLYDLWKEKAGRKKCAHCNHAGTSGHDACPAKMRTAAIFFMGLGYGITPCAPLIFIAGYCATLPFPNAAMVGAVFAMASAISPMLILLLLSGILAVRIYQEIPKYLDWFRAACYIVVAVYFAWSCFAGSTLAA
ncbi:MAG: sulfite exporter TauE/SafE family protein [Eubacterium sp.]|nr:sulfite exporter TauE/SafE family protein [Eubacterium sp.]